MALGMGHNLSNKKTKNPFKLAHRHAPFELYTTFVVGTTTVLLGSSTYVREAKTIDFYESGKNIIYDEYNDLLVQKLVNAFKLKGDIYSLEDLSNSAYSDLIKKKISTENNLIKIDEKLNSGKYDEVKNYEKVSSYNGLFGGFLTGLLTGMTLLLAYKTGEKVKSEVEN